MLIKQIFMAVLGTSFGMIVSGGVFTVLISVGLIPRFAGKMHIAKHIFILEEMVVLGTVAGDFFSIFSDYGNIGEWVLSNRVFGADNVSYTRLRARETGSDLGCRLLLEKEKGGGR
ncbi:MAG: stage V sporulation protein AB, partial [Lachnospiraceae bacterium]|nr:stage V sporulation protein AB [Lachnospiraceae bacterium]